MLIHIYKIPIKHTYRMLHILLFVLHSLKHVSIRFEPSSGRQKCKGIYIRVFTHMCLSIQSIAIVNTAFFFNT